jgi:ribonuclease H
MPDDFVSKDSHSLCLTKMDSVHRRKGSPLDSREDTLSAFQFLTSYSDDSENPPRPAAVNVFGEGPLVLSEIPESCRKQGDGGGVVLGIDEAGRGCVIGPMLYGMAFWHTSVTDNIPGDFNDSKQLTEQQREVLFEKILACRDIGFAARVLHASEISRNMLRPEPYNLNQMSHDAAIGMIRAVVRCNVSVQTCYIDTVGNPASYQRRLEQEFPGIEFVVESKADDKYAPCSAASIGTPRHILYI